MKKLLIFFMFIILTISLFACGSEDTDTTTSSEVTTAEEKSSVDQETTFQATILSIDTSASLMSVKPAKGSAELNSSNLYYIYSYTQYLKDGETPEVNDTVEITYNGDIQETYPAMLGKIYSIKIVK